jgi:8-oxo-dGTP pyrophosphatase MutT (NUDIX family)
MAGALLSGPAVLPAASVLVLRGSPLEVLMLRRHSASSVAPDAWVFPGGVVEAADEELARAAGDASTLAAMRVTAARETFEEAGLWLGGGLVDAAGSRAALLAGTRTFAQLLEHARLDLGRLVLTSRWITPVGIPRRFDTWFFLAEAPEGAVATAEQQEMTDVVWIAPQDALARAREMKLLFPTMRNLEALTPFPSAADAIAARQGAVVEPVQPVLVNGKPTLP